MKSLEENYSIWSSDSQTKIDTHEKLEVNVATNGYDGNWYFCRVIKLNAVFNFKSPSW